MWDQWKRTTRFINSARLALNREHRLWCTLEIEDEAAASLRAQLGTSDYRIGLDAHRNALNDEHMLCAMALLFSYAIAESAAAEKLGKETDDLGQVESWGQTILSNASRDWLDVLGGKAGIVEVTVYRNAIAHGATNFEARHVNRLKGASSVPMWKEGDPIVIDHELLKNFRARLKSLLRMGEVEQLTHEELVQMRLK